MKVPHTLTDAIRVAIRDSRYTPTAAGRMVGLSKSTMSRFMSGERGLVLARLDELARVLDLRIERGPDYPASESAGCGVVKTKQALRRGAKKKGGR